MTMSDDFFLSLALRPSSRSSPHWLWCGKESEKHLKATLHLPTRVCVCVCKFILDPQRLLLLQARATHRTHYYICIYILVIRLAALLISSRRRRRSRRPCYYAHLLLHLPYPLRGTGVMCVLNSNQRCRLSRSSSSSTLDERRKGSGIGRLLFTALLAVLSNERSILIHSFCARTIIDSNHHRPPSVKDKQKNRKRTKEGTD